MWVSLLKYNPVAAIPQCALISCTLATAVAICTQRPSTPNNNFDIFSTKVEPDTLCLLDVGPSSAIVLARTFPNSIGVKVDSTSDHPSV